MTAATIPAVLERGATAGWGTRRGRREPAGRPVRREAPLGMTPGGSREEKAVRETRLAPEETDSQAGVERTAVVAEQAALAELAARCLSGDAVAWEKLAKTQHRRVYGICYRFTNSQSEAEDLTQEVFLKIFRNLGSFDAAKGGFTTWLTTLTRNLLVDNYRRTRMERASDSLDDTYDGEEGGATKADKLADNRRSQEDRFAGMELRSQIQNALAQVSPDLREAV